MARGKGDHLVRWINAEHRATRKACGDFRRDLPVATADVENVLGPFQIQQAKLLLSHHVLQTDDCIR